MTLRRISLLTLFSISAPVIMQAADTLSVKTFRYAGTVKVGNPYIVDSLDNNGKSYDFAKILDGPLCKAVPVDAETVTALPFAGENEVCTVGFTVDNSGFVKGNAAAEGCKAWKLVIDGKVSENGAFSLDPGSHEFVLSYTGNDSARVSLPLALTAGKLSPNTSDKRLFSLDYNTIGNACGGVSLSPSGKFMAVRRRLTANNGKVTSYTEIYRTSDMDKLVRTEDFNGWLQTSDEYYCEKTGAAGDDLVCVNPETLTERLLCPSVPEGYYTVAPDGSYLIYSIESEGPKEGSVHQIVNPEDRQPGYRDRISLAKYDPSTSLMQPLTFGYHNCYLADISPDGKKILFLTSGNRFGPRPTEIRSLYMMDLSTNKVTPVFENDGFAGNDVCFSPDGSKVAVVGSAEAFGGIGNILPEGVIPNQYDCQLFVVDIASGNVRALSRDFVPSVQSIRWSAYDGKIYAIAENGDRNDLFRVDPQTAKWENLGNSEEDVSGFSIAKSTGMLAYFGDSLDNFPKLYTIDTRKLKERQLSSFPCADNVNIDLGKGYSYEFTSSRGDRITAFYVLPPDFDSNKKYPMLVHYYGGCSPSTRYCAGRWSPQYYAAQGYVFLVVNPSGASGFGAEFASRHVNTSGDGVVEDIIECVEHFSNDNPWVNKDKIGCFSASYGGFITQLLLEKTDIFATGISHAGISSNTSYWGEGYWGYSYSEVSMADSYPWTRKDLYVDKSPLYNVEKIHSPILFLHGMADTNVPVGESIQMFNALTLLGKETAFVVVDGENHGIMDFDKKRQWLRTISAWFAKYLKNDSSWWDELYPPKTL